jgi:(d)CTP diphosphatase
VSRPLAVCILLRRGDRYLFIERAPGRFAAGYWTPVTGRVEAGESLASAARRETFEETGLRVRVGAELGRTGTDSPGGGDAGFDLVWFAAELEEEGATLTLQPEEVANARWVTREEALRLEPLFPTTRRFLEGLAS